jgi:hypothetical protein
MALSKFIQDIGKEIEAKSGANIGFSCGTTRPTKKWIPEGEILKMKAIHLRTAEETKNGSVMKLQQFNPSALLEDAEEIRCRIPECSSTTHRRRSSRPSEKIKQDLFLCDAHRENLISIVSKRCAQENVVVNIASFKHEDFNGYTSLIGELEKAFVYIQKKTSTLSATDSLLVEVFLNTRNFLIIINALLNPDEDNTKTALGPYIEMFNLFLKHLDDPSLLPQLITALREIMNMVLLFFGVIYDWIFLGNPGTRVGAGVGILLGFVGGLAFTFPPATIAASAVVGLVGGGLIGSGGYDWYKDLHHMKMQQRHQEFMFRLFGRVAPSIDLFSTHGNSNGDLTIELHKRD